MTGGIFFTSDLHLGHRFVAGLRGFDDVEDHDYAVLEHWAGEITARDTVYVLGDISGGSGRTEARALNLMRGLPGTKHLIAGNHDSVASIHRTGWKQADLFSETFTSVRDFGRIRLQKRDVLLSHYPYLGEGDDHTDAPRYAQYRLPDLGGWLLHGHTHNADQRLHGRQIHVGLDAWGLKPVPLSVVEEIVLTEEAR